MGGGHRDRVGVTGTRGNHRDREGSRGRAGGGACRAPPPVTWCRPWRLRRARHAGGAGAAAAGWRRRRAAAAVSAGRGRAGGSGTPTWPGASRRGSPQSPLGGGASPGRGALGPGRSQVQDRGRWLRDGRGFGGGGGTCGREWQSGLGGVVRAAAEEAPGGAGTWCPPAARGAGAPPGRPPGAAGLRYCPLPARLPSAPRTSLPCEPGPAEPGPAELGAGWPRWRLLNVTAPVRELPVCPEPLPGGPGGSAVAGSPLSCPCILPSVPAERSFVPVLRTGLRRDAVPVPGLCQAGARVWTGGFPWTEPLLRGHWSLGEVWGHGPVLEPCCRPLFLGAAGASQGPLPAVLVHGRFPAQLCDTAD